AGDDLHTIPSPAASARYPCFLCITGSWSRRTIFETHGHHPYREGAPHPVHQAEKRAGKAMKNNSHRSVPLAVLATVVIISMSLAGNQFGPTLAPAPALAVGSNPIT